MKFYEMNLFAYGVVVGVVIMDAILFVLVINPMNDDINVMGESICLEEYNMTLDYFEIGDVLHCKSKEQIKEYDGLKVKLDVDTSITK